MYKYEVLVELRDAFTSTASCCGAARISRTAAASSIANRVYCQFIKILIYACWFLLLYIWQNPVNINKVIMVIAVQICVWLQNFLLCAWQKLLNVWEEVVVVIVAAIWNISWGCEFFILLEVVIFITNYYIYFAYYFCNVNLKCMFSAIECLQV